MNVEELKKAIEHWRERTGYDRLHPKAVLFDMDGTLYDSMRNHTTSWYELMTRQGVDCTREEFYLYEGMTGAQTITRLWNRQWGKTPTPDEIKELYHAKTLIFNTLPKVEPMAGAQAVVKHILDAGVTPVVVTGSGQPSVLSRLMTDFSGAFAPEFRVTAADVMHGKPHPEPYQRGMKIVGCQPWEVIAVENAPIGVQSAVASGAFTIAVTTGPIPPETMTLAGADLVLPSMQALADMLNDKNFYRELDIR